MVVDRNNNTAPGLAKLVNGGINQTFVSIELASPVGGPLNYEINLYAERLPQLRYLIPLRYPGSVYFKPWTMIVWNRKDKNAFYWLQFVQ